MAWGRGGACGPLDKDRIILKILSLLYFVLVESKGNFFTDENSFLGFPC